METSSADEARELFEIRFGTSLENQSAVADDPSTPKKDETVNEANWDVTSVIRVWQVCGRLPGEHVATAIRMTRESESGEASGWANGLGEVGMDWGTDQLGSRESGAYTDDYDVMRGLNIFDATLRHEIGHTVGSKGGFDASGGFVFNDFDWNEHADSEFSDLIQTFESAHGVGDDVPALRRVQIMLALGVVSDWKQASLDTALAGAATLFGDPEIVTDGQASDLYQFLVARMTGGAWNRMVDVEGRSYHVDYPSGGEWVSCPTGLYPKKVSRYAMRSPAEWFAEAYATFYADADTPNTEVGTLLRSADPVLYQKMYNKVHLTSIWNFATTTGQEMGHSGMGV